MQVASLLLTGVTGIILGYTISSVRKNLITNPIDRIIDADRNFHSPPLIIHYDTSLIVKWGNEESITISTANFNSGRVLAHEILSAIATRRNLLLNIHTIPGMLSLR